MDAIAQSERAKYEAVWKQPKYRVRCHGLALWEQRREVFPARVESAIDLGCGTGRLVARWLSEGIDAVGVDFADNAVDAEVREAANGRLYQACLWDLGLGRRFDLGVCADVMEHIPEEKVDLTLRCVADHVETAVFKIAWHSSRWLEHELHVTRRDPAWWSERLAKAFRSVERLPLDVKNNCLFRCR